MTIRKPDDVSALTGIVTTLRELIVALDRRVPHVERAGEVQIARDASILRREALRRIEELTHASSPDHPIDNQDLVEAIMTDDGGAAPTVVRLDIGMHGRKGFES